MQDQGKLRPVPERRPDQTVAPQGPGPRGTREAKTGESKQAHFVKETKLRVSWPPAFLKAPGRKKGRLPVNGTRLTDLDTSLRHRQPPRKI